MSLFVFAAVLFAAACHAGWNTLVKKDGDPFSRNTAITVLGGLIALPLVFVFGLPAPESLKWMAGSVCFHTLYFIALVQAYRHGDMGHVYPIARGSAPLLTALVSAVVLVEPLGLHGWAGIFLLAGGVVLLSLRGGRGVLHLDRRAVAYALLTAMAICGYTMMDGLGGRASNNPNAYSVLLFVINGVMCIFIALIWGGRKGLLQSFKHWKSGLVGGGLSLLSYWIAIAAMTMAPLALVAALRETSVLFGALLAVIFLKEKLRGTRIFAAIAIVIGMIMIKLA